MREENSKGIKVNKRVLVKPCESTWNGILPLSEFDQVGIITHSSHVHFFKRPVDENWVNNSEENNIFKTLNESLGRALVPFYPLAGRLRSLSGGRFELECNAMGAELIGAECEMNMTDFGDFYSSTDKFIKDLLPKMDYYTRGESIHDLPVLVVQVTRFQCGGLCFGMSVSHLVVDGRSAFHFTMEWARLARGEQAIMVQPCHDRTLLLANEAVPHGTTLNGEPIRNYFNDFFLGRVEKFEWAEKISPTFVLLTKDKIESLKDVATRNKDVRGRPYSRFEIITAYMWICVSKARQLKNEEITNLSICVDVRGRLVPQLPSSYFGNAIVYVRARSTVEELLARPLAYACSKVREAIKSVTSEYVTSTIEYFKSNKSLAKYQYIDDRGHTEGPSPCTHDNNVDVLSWLNLSDLGIDFGWGKEFYTGPCFANGFDGDIMLFPGDSAGSVVVSACLHSIEKLLEYINSPVV
ncbi:hypothetical protein vseg_002649 [Gypsophila vaccaria]